MVATQRTPTKPTSLLTKAKLRTASRAVEEEARWESSSETDLSPEKVDSGGGEAEQVDCEEWVTPTKRKKRRTCTKETGSSQLSSLIPIDSPNSDRILVTPVKHQLYPSSLAYLPTPPRTPTISLSPPSTSSPCTTNIYARARSLLRLSAHDNTAGMSELVGRTVEREQLYAFLKFNLPALFPEQHTNCNSAHFEKALYVSGSPGTGKTALLQNILQHLQTQTKASSNMKTGFLNCTTIQRPLDLWERLAIELGLEKCKKDKKPWDAKAFEAKMRSIDCTERNFIVLDEIDHLLLTSGSIASDTLSSLFSLALDPSSRLVLVCIANALDLTERHSAIFSSTAEGRQPTLLHFRPFQSDEMVAIIKARLNTLHDPISTLPDESPSLPIMMPAALELAAKKVSAVTGDLRSFLSLIRKAVELFEEEQKKRLSTVPGPLVTPPNRKRKAEPSTTQDTLHEDPLSKYDATTAPKLTPAHILKATRLVSMASSASSCNSGGHGSNAGLSTVAQSSTAILESKVSELNLQQRLALTSFVIGVQQQQSTVWSRPATHSITAGKADSLKPNEIHAAYRSLLEKEDVLRPVGSSEFADLLSGLHTRGLVGLARDYTASRPSPGASSSLSSTNTATSPTSLAPPMLRRTSSSSSTSSIMKSRSRSPSPSAAQTPLILLYTLPKLTIAIRTSKPVEAASICSIILNKEDKRLRRMKLANERNQIERKERINAPSEGFHGNGLDHLEVNLVGERDKRGRVYEEDENEDENGDMVEKRRAVYEEDEVQHQ